MLWNYCGQKVRGDGGLLENFEQRGASEFAEPAGLTGDGADGE